MSSSTAGRTVFAILAAISFSHLLNDLVQSLLPAIYPMLKSRFALDFWQVGLITLTNQLTASLLQPLVGLYTDRRPQPYLLAVGMTVTLSGLLLLSVADRFPLLLLSAGLVGVGSSVFHPESSRVARVASGGRYGFAQSLFQTGGNAGTSLGPLLAAFIVLPHGQRSVAWFSIAAVLGIVVLWRVGHWYTHHAPRHTTSAPVYHVSTLPPAKVKLGIFVLLMLVFSKFIYMSSLVSYYTFFLIHRFGLTARDANLHLFVFLAAVAAGTFIGGPVGDRFGRKYVIWISILGVLPFTAALPYVDLFWTTILSVLIGVILASAFSAILVYAQELLPGRVGLVSGLFFGLAFGTGGLGAALLGKIADRTSLDFIYHVCAWLPAIGLLTALLPDLPAQARTSAGRAAEPATGFESDLSEG